VDVLCGHIEQGLHRSNRSRKLSNLFLVHYEHVAISVSSLCIDERDAAGETLLILAAERDKVELDVEDVRVLLDAGANSCAVSESSWTALHGAAECNCMPAIEMLIEAGAEVLVEARLNKTPLDITLQYAKPEAAEGHTLDVLGLTGSMAWNY
jgi:ankyrin repeat protein